METRDWSTVENLKNSTFFKGISLAEETNVAEYRIGSGRNANCRVEPFDELKATVEEFLAERSGLDVDKKHAVANVHLAGIAADGRSEHSGPRLDDFPFEELLLEIVLTEKIHEQPGNRLRLLLVHVSSICK